MPFADLLRLFLETIPLYLRRLDLLLIVAFVLLMIFGQYQRLAATEQRLLGFVKNRPGPQVVRALAAGLLGGALASVVFVLLGISLRDIGIGYLWILALTLMLFHPRFLCFSYGAGILALAHLATGFPRIDIPALMALVGVLHLVEAVLIYVSGAMGATPVFMRGADGRVVGGFSMQRFWPLPFVALVGAWVAPELLRGAEAVSMPSWWPIIEPSEPGGPGLEYAFALFPVVAALGYSDVAVTSLPQAKARRTAKSLLLYSLGLLALAVGAQASRAVALAAALFSPLAHEWVIARARALEVRGKPCFTGFETMVLDVYPDSPAARVGLVAGDVIKAVNGVPVRTREELAAAMEPWLLQARFEVENPITGERRSLHCNEKIPPLGVLLVPGPGSPAHMDLNSRGGAVQSLRRIGRRLARRWRWAR